MKKLLLFLTFLLVNINLIQANETTKFQAIDSVQLELDSLWQKLIHQSSCLTGCQYVTNGTFGNEGCVMSRRGKHGWNLFFRYPSKDLTGFLITQLTDQKETAIHTCPCNLASTGEVAIYALQKIHRTNWFELRAFIHFSERKGMGCEDSRQTWLSKILANAKQRNLMIRSWKEFL